MYLLNILNKLIYFIDINFLKLTNLFIINKRSNNLIINKVNKI